MRKLAVLARLALVLAIGFVAGVFVGQQATPARAQTATVEARAAAIKAELVDSITRYQSTYNATFSEELSQVDLEKSIGPMASYLRGTYVGGLAKVARYDTLLGQYARYLPEISPKSILEDRFLDHFSFSIAKYGLPPAMPPLTDAELSERDRMLNMLDLGTGKALQLQLTPERRIYGEFPTAQQLLLGR